MKNPFFLSSALALGLVSGALTLPSLAIAADTPALGGPKMGGPGMARIERDQDGGGPREMVWGHRTHKAPFEHIEGGLAFLKAELKITPAQEAAWTPFETAVREQAALAKTKFEARQAQSDKRDNKAPTVPERIAHAKERLEFRLSAIDALSEKTNALYTALSAEQKKAADELLPSPLLPFPL